MNTKVQAAVQTWANSLSDLVPVLKGIDTTTKMSDIRDSYAKMLAQNPAPTGVKFEAVDMGGVPGTLVTPDEIKTDAVVMYIHGGAYIVGRPDGYHGIGGNYAKMLGARVYMPDYRLAPEPYRLIVPRDLEGEDWSELLSSQPFIRYDRSSFGGRQVDRFLRQMHFTLQEVCELDELEAIIKLVEKGVGIALVPQTETHQQWPAGVRALDLGQHTFHRDIGLVHRSRQSFTEPVRILAQLISDQVTTVSE